MFVDVKISMTVDQEVAGSNPAARPFQIIPFQDDYTNTVTDSVPDSAWAEVHCNRNSGGSP